MGLEDIKKKILSDAELQKKQIIDKAEKEAQNVIDEYKKKAEEYKKSILERAKEEGDGIKRGILIDAKMKVKSEILKKKREWLDKVYEEAKNKILESPYYKNWMKLKIKKAALSGDEKIVVSKEEEELNDIWLLSLNKDLSSKLTFADERGNFKGGVMIQTGEGSFIDLTLDTLINEMKEEMERELANILF